MRASAILAALSLGACLAPLQTAQAAGCTISGGAPIVTASAVDFGSYDAGGTSPSDANGLVQLRCPLGVGLLPSFDIALSAGMSGNFLPRQMAFGASRLGYNIYTAPNYLDIWGDGSNGTVTQTYSSLLALGTINFTTYGRIPAGQFVAAGVYDDTILVTVTY